MTNFIFVLLQLFVTMCVCVCFNDGCLCAPLCPVQKLFFPRTTIEWNRLDNNSVHADSVVSFRLLMAHTYTHTHTQLYPPPRFFVVTIAVPSATFQSSGISPLSMDLLKRIHSGIAHCSLNSFSTLGGTWSGHWAFFFFLIKCTYPAQPLGLL